MRALRDCLLMLIALLVGLAIGNRHRQPSCVTPAPVLHGGASLPLDPCWPVAFFLNSSAAACAATSDAQCPMCQQRATSHVRGRRNELALLALLPASLPRLTHHAIPPAAGRGLIAPVFDHNESEATYHASQQAAQQYLETHDEVRTGIDVWYLMNAFYSCPSRERIGRPLDGGVVAALDACA